MSLREEVLEVLSPKKEMQWRSDKEMVDAILSLFSKAVEEAEPVAESGQYSFEAGVSEYSKNLNALLKETI